MSIHSPARFALALLLSAAAPAALWSCSSSSSDSSSKPGVSGSYRGLLTGATESGVMDVTIGAASSTQSLHPLGTGAGAVTGTLTLAGSAGPVQLTGSYDPSTGTLTLSATTPAGTYSLTGTSSATGFSGTYTSPSGSGVFTLAPAASGNVDLYCGTYGPSAGQTSGIWNLLVDGAGHATGSHCDASGCGLLTGSVNGGSVTLQDPASSGGAATGTISNGTAQGTYPDGVWSGSTSACSGAVADGGADAGQDANDGGVPVDAGNDADAGSDAAAPQVETIVTGLNNPVSIALDSTDVYWLSGGDGAIQRCALSGCTTPETVASGLSVPSAVAVANGTAYWTSGFRYIMSCSVGSNGACAGTPAQMADLGAQAYPAHLWVAGSNLYFIAENATSRIIDTCPLAGCTTGYPKPVFTSTAGVPFDNAPLAGLAVDSAYAYIASFTGGLFRVTMTGAESADAASAVKLADTPYTTSEIDLDGTTLRVAVAGENRVAQCTTPDCAALTDAVTGLAAPGGTRGDATYVYGFDRGQPDGSGGYVAGTGTIWRVAK